MNIWGNNGLSARFSVNALARMLSLVRHVATLSILAVGGFCGFLILLAISADAVSAAEFMVDPAQSSLTLTGTINGPNGVGGLLPQTPGSMTAEYTGELDVDLSTPGTIQLLDALMEPVADPGPFQPTNSPADYAFAVSNFYQGAPGYGAVANSTADVSSSATPLSPSGTFDGHTVSMTLFSTQFSVSAAGLGASTGFFNSAMTNISALTPTLSAVGDQYKLDIPFQGTLSSNIAGYPTTYNLSGNVVAYRPITYANGPNVVNGGFEAEKNLSGPHDNFIQGWTVVDGVQPNNFAATQPAGLDMRPTPAQGINEAFINVFNDSAGFYQMAIPPGSLAPNTTYMIKFDLGNRDMTDAGTIPNNDMDPFISLRGFFTLGSDATDFSKHIGAPFVLNHLSDTAEGAYLKDQSFTLDTSTLSAAQLSQGLNVVFFATSTTTLDRGQVDIDNVRLSVVPEPATIILAVLGGLALLARRR